MDKAVKDQLHMFRMDAAETAKRKTKDEPNIFVNKTHMQPLSNDVPLVAFSHVGMMGNRQNNLPFGRASITFPQNSQMPYGSGYTQQPVANVYGNPVLHGGDFTNSGILYPAATSFPYGQRNTQQDAAKADESVEERKRLELQRQQQKIRQSFQAQKNKTTNPDELLNKISQEIQSSTKITAGPPVPKPPVPITPPVVAEPARHSSTPPQISDPTNLSSNSAVQTQTSVPAQKPLEINDLMMRFSDLSSTAAPSKAFTKTLPVAELPTLSKITTSLFSDSRSARDWKQLPTDLGSAFSSADTNSHSSSSQSTNPDLPPWCYEQNSLPEEYYLLLGHFRNQAALDKSSVVQFLNRCSGLSYSTIEHIWTNVCRTKPDYLTRGELCAALALVGLAQSNFDVHHLTIDVLRRLPSPPVPRFTSRSTAPQASTFPAVYSLADQSINTADSHLHPTLQEINLKISPLVTATTTTVTDDEDEFADFVSAPVVTKPTRPPILPTPAKGVSLFDDIDLTPTNEGFAKISPLNIASSELKEKETKSVSLGWAITEKKPTVKNEVTAKASAVKSRNNSQDEWSSWTNEISSAAQAKPGIKIPQMFPTSTSTANNSTKSSSVETPAAEITGDRYAAFRDLFPVSTVDHVRTADQPTVNMWDDIEEPISALDAPHLLSVKPVTELKTSVNSSPGLDTLSLSSLDFGINNGFRLNLDGYATPELTESRASPEPPTFGVDTVSSVPTDVFIQAIRSCSELLREAVGVFNNISDSKLVVSVVGKAKSYIQGVIEAYRVGKRIALASKVYGLLHNTELLNVLAEMEEVWADFQVFLNLGAVEVAPGTMDFSPCLFGVQHPAVEAVCGLCLLNVDGKSRLKGSSTDGVKVEVAERFYHVSCANFWLNLVTDSLPRLNQIDTS